MKKYLLRTIYVARILFLSPKNGQDMYEITEFYKVFQ